MCRIRTIPPRACPAYTLHSPGLSARGCRHQQQYHKLAVSLTHHLPSLVAVFVRHNHLLLSQMLEQAIAAPPIRPPRRSKCTQFFFVYSLSSASSSSQSFKTPRAPSYGEEGH